MRRLHFSLVTAIALLPASGLAAEAVRTPARDEVVETQLLAPAVKRTVRALALSAGTGSSTTTGDLAAAQQMIEAGRVSGDPRALGYAEELLRSRPESATLLVLKATIEQSRHRFNEANALLDRALALEPANVQALLTRANIAQVTGNARTALEYCSRIEPLDAQTGAICRAGSLALVGANEQAIDRLRAIVSRSDARTRAWALSILGDIEQQNGQRTAAIRAYTISLAASDDVYTRVALAEALLSDGQGQQALSVLRSAPATDAVLLQRWRALRTVAKGDGATVALEREIADRNAAALARGDWLHAREAAWFALERGEAEPALDLARRNWSAQREPADLLLLVSAGKAAQHAPTLAEAQAWLTTTGVRDRRIDAVLLAAQR